MKKELPAWLMLGIVTSAAGLLLGFANDKTKDKIAEQAMIAADAARQSVLQEAEVFEQQELAEGTPVDNLYMGKKGDETIGYVAQVTTKGYGGSIEVITGINLDGVITGISVGGSKFAETAGLGARSKEPWFAEQYKDKTAPVKLGEDIQAISGATITTGAVTTAVNKAAEYMWSLVKPADAEGDAAPVVELLPGNPPLTEGTPDDTIVAVWTADNGMVVESTGEGYDSTFHIKVGILTDGTIHTVQIQEDKFNESPGFGMLALEDPTYLQQFVGQSGVVAYGDGIDALSGATFTSEGMLQAINKALAFAAK